MNKFKMFFYESKDQAVPYALPAIRSYKQNLLFNELQKQQINENKERLPGSSSSNTKVFTNKRSDKLSAQKQYNSTLGKARKLGENKTKYQKSEENKNLSIIKQKASKIKSEKPLKGAKVLNENLENKERPFETSFKLDKGLSSIRNKINLTRLKTPNFGEAGRINTVPIQSNIEITSISNKRLLRSQPSTANDPKNSFLRNETSLKSKTRSSATRSVSRKRPKMIKKFSFSNLNSSYFKISDLSIAPLL